MSEIDRHSNADMGRRGPSLKDQFALLIAALVCAAGAWAFWHFLGADAANILGIVFIVSLAVDNRRLRAKLRQCPTPPPE